MSGSLPSWVLAVAYWLHMAATIVWIGGLFFQSVVLAPSIVRSLAAQEQASLVLAVRRRFEPLAWLSLAILAFTGLTQMAANPHYAGLLQIHDTWSAAILAKHIVIIIMVVAAGFQTWFIQPQVDRLTLLNSRSPVSPDAIERLARRQRVLSTANLAFGLIVLGLTAVARSA